MIIEQLLNAIYTAFTALLGFINIPSFPPELINGFYSYIDLIFDNSLSIISFLVPWNIVKIGLPIALVVANAKYVYFFVMWVLKKIPMLGIS